MTNKLLLISDTHCNFDIMEQIIALELGYGPIDGVLHCGDIGAYDSADLSQVSEREQYLIKKHKNPIHAFKPYLTGKQIFPMPIYVIPGNHEDFSLVDNLISGAIKIKHLHMLAQGELITLPGGERELVVMGIGKILPDGLSNRNKPKIIQEADIIRAQDAGTDRRVDILLLHEPPMLGQSHRGRVGSSVLTELVKYLQPRLVIAGHIHAEYRAQIGQSQVIGLGYGVKGRYAVMDADLNITFKSLYKEAIRLLPITESEQSPLLPTPKKLSREPLLVTGKEICAHFGLDDQQHTKKLLGDFFKALKLQIAQQPNMSKEDAFVLAARFLPDARSATY